MSVFAGCPFFGAGIDTEALLVARHRHWDNGSKAIIFAVRFSIETEASRRHPKSIAFSGDEENMCRWDFMVLEAVFKMKVLRLSTLTPAAIVNGSRLRPTNRGMSGANCER